MKYKSVLFSSVLLVSIFFAGEFLCVPCSPVSTCGNAAWAEITEPAPRDEAVSIIVSGLMNQMHISKRSIDKEISHRTLLNLLKALDPQKLYFYESDVNIFQQKELFFREWFEKGRMQFAYVVFKTYLDRMDKRITTMLELLKEPIDFTVDETMVTNRDELKYPWDAEDARKRLRQRVKYDLLLLQMDDLMDQKKADKATDAAGNSDASADGTAVKEKKNEEPKTPEQKHQEAVEKLTKRYTSLQKRMHQVDSDDLLEIYLTAMTTSFDPHSSYMSPRTLENFEIQMRLELEGIGASLMSDDGYVVVKHLVPGGAADKEGTLKIDDKICSVGQGVDGPMEDIVDMKLDEVVKKVRGKQGTVVRLEVIPAGGGPKKIVQITRAKIELKDSEANGTVFEVGKKANGAPYKIGVINLPSFYMDMQGARSGREYKSTTRDVLKILVDFRAKGVDSVVLDLRNNGGGSLQEAISLTGLFIRQGTVVQVKDADNRVTPYDDTDAGIAWSGPLVVVINKLSASASEILAGAIQDYKRGLIVGDKTTHGKGTVQTLENVGFRKIPALNPMKLGALKVTMQQFYRPLGDSTQYRGVESDIEIPAITTHMDIGEGDLDYPMPFDQVPPQKIDNYNLTSPDVIKALKASSENRVRASDDFVKMRKKIGFYCDMKEKKTVSLNAQKFLSERSDMLEDEEKKLEENVSRSANEIKRDFYLDEVMNISLDYMRALER